MLLINNKRANTKINADATLVGNLIVHNGNLTQVASDIWTKDSLSRKPFIGHYSRKQKVNCLRLWFLILFMGFSSRPSIISLKKKKHINRILNFVCKQLIELSKTLFAWNSVIFILNNTWTIRTRHKHNYCREIQYHRISLCLKFSFFLFSIFLFLTF